MFRKMHICPFCFVKRILGLPYIFKEEVARMSVQVENLEKNMAKLTVEVPAEELEKAIQAAYMKQKSRINLPGCRKG